MTYQGDRLRHFSQVKRYWCTDRAKKFIDLTSVDGGLEEEPRESTSLSSERQREKTVCENECTRKIVRIQKKRGAVSFWETESTEPHQEQNRRDQETEIHVADENAYEEELGTEMVEADDGTQKERARKQSDLEERRYPVRIRKQRFAWNTVLIFGLRMVLSTETVQWGGLQVTI
ncbi:hypothetical protein OUZ56_012412 [Daphnia magna]|uniref:Uncharacterized protein n=1 Tax=Daphnia magna TaxID=35525 RepID=A0ABQ9Z2X5_9CRUS|nr:hypothetical protein OUZ56_012412 [Daphnia magna]